MGKLDHFWRWSAVKDEAGAPARELVLEGPISSESWFGDEVTPALFKAELRSQKGPVIVRINSPGGECIAAAQIYDMLRDYSKDSGRVTVRISGIAASAASVIAMAGDTVEMSPVGLMMIHDPSTCIAGNEDTLKAEIVVLKEFKESIINAYELKTKLPREQIAKLMSNETWLNSGKALELGFIDKVQDWAEEESPAKDKAPTPAAYAFDPRGTDEGTLQRIVASMGGAYSCGLTHFFTQHTHSMEHHHPEPPPPSQAAGIAGDVADEASRKLHAAKLQALRNANIQ
jgi:ATP-dependent Clp protease, protease subunit